MKTIKTKEYISKEAGWQTMPNIDSDRYPQRKGLEGPYRMKSGKILYYDPKGIAPGAKSMGAYYDPSTDMYLTFEEYEEQNNPRHSA